MAVKYSPFRQSLFTLEREVNMPLLEQLQCDYAKISEIIKTHRAEIPDSSHDKIPLNTLHDVYLETLEDALKTLTSMLDYLKQHD